MDIDNWEKLHIPQNFDDNRIAEQLKNAYATLSSEEADNVLVEYYKEISNGIQSIAAKIQAISL